MTNVINFVKQEGNKDKAYELAKAILEKDDGDHFAGAFSDIAL
jgi:hypothetical protein